MRSTSFPEKQEALIADMQEWCRRHWQREVGRTTVLQKPFYDALANESKRFHDFLICDAGFSV
jgi:hypothetical protein